ncbi:thioredoxin-dependent thiol peroxidase [Candidatus Nitrospira neomarina]|uniref:thioredoxin-dependent peroxiredoxin n=1 Tax=Candidatus Nitrospira neomarina TaxID=3020899 RepID=A0AA96K1N7_9BACT|nr:thioredoxin-dependent thiol peroxidase [Candidatus Nitrospira neomarina]WNM60854.1 thioredoxin-dependent thiol peroxidase [Candidatus Nitrospira neomarina]
MASKVKKAQTKKKGPVQSKPKVVAKKKAAPKRSSSKSQGLVSGSRNPSTKIKAASTPKTKKPAQQSPRIAATSELQVGDPAPAFSLPDDAGRIVNSSDLRGKKVVVYFYPKDDTPGCTTEACSFRDGIQELRKSGAVVFGVSADSVSSHRKFSNKFQLNFPLLSDESKAMIQAYGVWKEKSMYGRKYMGIERTTVVINEDGTIRNVFPKVKVNGHFTEVLQALR